MPPKQAAARLAPSPPGPVDEEGLGREQALEDVPALMPEPSQARAQAGGGPLLLTDTPPTCQSCRRWPSPHVVCGRCELAVYCRKSCQVEHWGLHRYNCKMPEQQAAQARLDKMGQS